MTNNFSQNADKAKKKQTIIELSVCLSAVLVRCCCACVPVFFKYFSFIRLLQLDFYLKRIVQHNQATRQKKNTKKETDPLIFLNENKSKWCIFLLFFIFCFAYKLKCNRYLKQKRVQTNFNAIFSQLQILIHRTHKDTYNLETELIQKEILNYGGLQCIFMISRMFFLIGEDALLF